MNSQRIQRMRHSENAYKTHTTHAKLRQRMQNPDIECETQTTHTKARHRIRNPDSTYETQTMHTKPRHLRMRNPDKAIKQSSCVFISCFSRDTSREVSI